MELVVEGTRTRERLRLRCVDKVNSDLKEVNALYMPSITIPNFYFLMLPLGDTRRTPIASQKTSNM